MTQGQGAIVIIGAGMSGMLAARYIKAQQPQQSVILIDHARSPGGMYRGLDLPGFGYCDQAMRMLYETGIGHFDALMHDILPKEAWHLYPDNYKDIAGIYWQGALQSHSPYIDLRRLPADAYRRCEQALWQAITIEHTDPPANAAVYCKRRFGDGIAPYLEAVLEKLYGMPADALDVVAASQPAMDRVVLYDEEAMRLHMQDERLRSILAWPDQLTLPVKRHPPQSALYQRPRHAPCGGCFVPATAGAWGGMPIGMRRRLLR
jgi:protoporphyrinogen oxidase